MKNQFIVALLGSILFLFSYIAQAEEKALTAEEAAKELANPNTPLASLNFKSQFRWFDGDLPNDRWSIKLYNVVSTFIAISIR